MGSYLIIDGKENNTKSISYTMINLLRELLPEKKSLHGESVFAMTKEEVAKALCGATELLSDEYLLKQYIENHSEEYGMKNDFKEVKEIFGWIQRCFSKTLSEMVIFDKNNIICEWE